MPGKERAKRNGGALVVVFEVQTGVVVVITMAVAGSVVTLVIFMMRSVPTVTIGIVVQHVYQTRDSECCFRTLCGYTCFKFVRD